MSKTIEEAKNKWTKYKFNVKTHDVVTVDVDEEGRWYSSSHFC